MANDDRAILDALARTAPTPPDVHWGRYRAELREKLETRRRRRAWWRRPVPLALSASLAGALLFFAVWGGRENGTGMDLVTLDEALLGGRLGLLQQYAVVERLDLLEELDVIRNLDRLAAGRQG
ncbi:MAG: hypothetical protein AABZ83_07400 [candidate division NC10 bacterium]